MNESLERIWALVMATRLYRNEYRGLDNLVGAYKACTDDERLYCALAFQSLREKGQ